MDNIEIGIDAAKLVGENLLARVSFNGDFYPDPEYFVLLDDLFSAIRKPNAKIRLLGSCGIFDCCGHTSIYKLTPGGVRWDSFLVPWNQIHEIAEKIIQLGNEQCRLNRKADFQISNLQQKLDLYKESLGLFEKLCEGLNDMK